MTRELILGELVPDLACAIAAGFVEYRLVAVNLDTLTLHDAHMRPVGTQRNWLDAADPLHAATRDYLTARRAALLAGSCGPGSSAWAAAAVARKRDEANRKALAARVRIRELLEDRGVLTQARAAGLNVTG